MTDHMRDSGVVHSRPVSDEPADLLRRGAEARARAEAAVAYERERRSWLERSRPELEERATSWRRVLGRVTGSRFWDTSARHISPRSPDSFPKEGPAAERARHENALARREELRRQNDRLERRLRTLDRGTGELRRG